MKSIRLRNLSLVCLSTLSLAGLTCQFTTLTAATPTAVATLTPAPPSEASPQPYPLVSVEPYLAPSEPYPGAETIQVTPLTPVGASVLYPGVQDGAEVYWEQAVAMILNGEVTQVMQTHDLKVYLTLKDGRTLFSIEPAIDDVMRIIESCGDPCKAIMIATE